MAGRADCPTGITDTPREDVNQDPGLSGVGGMEAGEELQGVSHHPRQGWGQEPPHTPGCGSRPSGWPGADDAGQGHSDPLVPSGWQLRAQTALFNFSMIAHKKKKKKNLTPHLWEPIIWLCFLNNSFF